jgi:hypothetical protein
VHIIFAVLALVLSIALRRSTLPLILFVLAWVSIPVVAKWADSRPVRIPVSRMMPSYEWEAWQKELGFKVWMQGQSGRGDEMFVDRTPGRADRVRAELPRFGIVRVTTNEGS